MRGTIYVVQGELNHTPVKWGEATTREKAEEVARREIGEDYHIEEGEKVWGDCHRYGVFAEISEQPCGCPDECIHGLSECSSCEFYTGHVYSCPLQFSMLK